MAPVIVPALCVIVVGPVAPETSIAATVPAIVPVLTIGPLSEPPETRMPVLLGPGSARFPMKPWFTIPPLTLAPFVTLTAGRMAPLGLVSVVKVPAT